MAKKIVRSKKVSIQTDKKEGIIEKVPPDGGWGWAVVFAYIITGLTCIPIIQNFGLIYKQRLQELELTSSDITNIICLNCAVGQILGVFQGPLLKKYGFRIMATFGVLTLSVGSLLTGLSRTFTHFVLTYGIVTSIGFTYTLTSFSLAMNSYFKKKRSRASGLWSGFTGLGPVFMPQFVTFSLNAYGVLGTAALLAALNGHGLIGACLLQPIEWHLVDKKPEEGEEGKEAEAEEALTNFETDSVIRVEPLSGYEGGRRLSSYSSLQRQSSHSDAESTQGTAWKHSSESVRARKIRSISGSEDSPPSDRFYLRQKSSGTNLEVLNEQEEQLLSPTTRTGSQYFLEEDVVGKAMKSTLDLLSPGHRATLASTETLDSLGGSTPNIYWKKASIKPNITLEDFDKAADVIEPTKERTKRGFWATIGRTISKQFDLDLLRDPTYVIITLGLSIAVIGELIFSLLTPFILYEVGLDLEMTAYFMSITAIADIVSRFVSPYIGECVRLNSRLMYLIALFCLLLSRASLLFVSGSIGLFIVAVGVGFAKGVRTVFWTQILPDHVPANKLGSAMSIQNLANGILVICSGPLAGAIIEINNSYLNVIYFSNALTGVTIVLWLIEILVLKCCCSKKAPGDNSSAR